MAEELNNKIQQLKNAVNSKILDTEAFEQRVVPALKKLNQLILQLKNNMGDYLKGYQDKIIANEGEINNLRAQLDQNALLIQDKINEATALNEKIVEMQNQITELQNMQANEIQNLKAESERAMNEMTARLNTAEGDKTALQQQMEQARQENETRMNEITGSIAQKDEQINKLNADIQGATAQIQTINTERDNLKKENEGLIQNIVNASAAISEAVDKISKQITTVKNNGIAQRSAEEMAVLIEGISNALQGRPAGDQSQSQTQDGGWTYGKKSSKRTTKRGGWLYSAHKKTKKHSKKSKHSSKSSRRRSSRTSKRSKTTRRSS